MKCQIPFSGKNIINLSSAELAQRVVMVKLKVLPYILWLLLKKINGVTSTKFLK